ncbi:DUF5753 domain-containing protein [Streptomyces atratus]|uniref:DUF5753 domain-containing protein n=1 Tax=Streptomyces atratus TaxID=1893 RepID=A0A1K1UH58_STRAR|nr:hypothetical protein SAMN02787144_1001547 [Streptomyces atratus]
MITDVESATPALCRLQLGRELRQLRQAAGLTSTQVVRTLICSPSKLAPLKFAAVINEAVLRRLVGGPAVMRAQIEHLAEVAELPSVRVQVIPFRAGVHPGMNGAFTLLRFDDAPSIAYLENLGGASVTRRRADGALYEEAFNDLQILAVGPRESLGMIREAIKEH